MQQPVGVLIPTSNESESSLYIHLKNVIEISNDWARRMEWRRTILGAFNFPKKKQMFMFIFRTWNIPGCTTR